jgi:hypothetical protein
MIARAVIVALSATLCAWGAARAAEPVAVLTEIELRQGQVHVRPQGEREWTPPRPLQSLRPGDEVRVIGDARAVVVFTGGGHTETVTSATSPFAITVPGAEAVADRARAILAGVTRFLLGQQRERPLQSLSVRAFTPTGPVILAPRATTVLPGGLTFEWLGSDRLTYTVRLIGPQGAVWEQAGVERKALAYPDTAPALVPGARYHWELDSKQHGVQRADFDVATVERVTRVRSDLDALTSATGVPPSTVVLVRAGLLFENGFYADARRELLAGIAAVPGEPTLHLLLAHVYDRTGLKQLAGNEFETAESLTGTRP